MDAFKIRFELIGLPKMTNAGGREHWGAKVKEAKKWKTMVWLAVANMKPFVPIKKARITFIRHSSKEPDFDGLVSGFKHILDGLVESRIIDNDKPSVIGQPTYLWEKADPRMGKVSISLEEVECREFINAENAANTQLQKQNTHIVPHAEASEFTKRKTRQKRTTIGKT